MWNGIMAEMFQDVTVPQILQASHRLVMVLNPEGKVVFHNDEGFKQLGYAPGELIGLDWCDACLPESVRDKTRSYLKHMFHDAAHFNQHEDSNQIYGMQLHEKLVLNKAHEERMVQWHNSLIGKPGGPPRGMLCAGEDVTVFRQAETELRLALTKYKALFESFPLGVTMADAEGKIVETNALSEKLLGLSRDEHTCRNIDGENWQMLYRDGSLMPPDEYASVRALKTQTIVENLVMGVKRGDNEPLWLSVSAAPLDIPGMGVLVTYGDITRRVKIEQELERANDALKAAFEREHMLASIDSLTGVYNRRSLFEQATHETAVATRYEQPLSMILLDLDHFKQVNDTFGHMLGDELLIEVTKCIRKSLRSADVLGRIGGEEFVLVLPMTTAKQAFTLAERIREDILAIRLKASYGELSASISAGVVEQRKMREFSQCETTESMIRRADDAMYAAKRAGRNCTILGG